MKKMLLVAVTAILVFNSYSLKAQEQYMGQRRTYIKTNSSFKFIESGNAKDGSPYDYYEAVKDSIELVFYYRKDICYCYKEIINKSMLIQGIRDLNKRYVKVDGTHWIDKDSTIAVYLSIPEDGTVFTIEYSKI